MSEIWLIIGRFQPLHKGHELLIKTALTKHSAVLILIGSSNITNWGNPYNFELRKEILQENFPDTKLHIWALPDFEDDTQWKDMILSYIPDKVSNVTQYCGDSKNDSAVIALLSLQDPLPFNLIIREIPRSIIPLSATQVRSWIQEKNTKKLSETLSEKTLEKLAIYEHEHIITS